MARKQLPQPTELGSQLGRHAPALIRAVGHLPFIGFGLEAFFEHQRNLATDLLIRKIEEGNIGLIDDEQYQYLVPNVYAYFESARTGEHRHNLDILSEILLKGYTDKTQAPFAVRNAAKRLGGMSVRDLELLTICHRSFLRSKNDPIREKLRSDWPDWTCVDYFRDELGTGSESTVRNALSEFLIRGFLSVDLQPSTFGGNGYYKTPYFEEVILAAQKISKS